MPKSFFADGKLRGIRAVQAIYAIGAADALLQTEGMSGCLISHVAGSSVEKPSKLDRLFGDILQDSDNILRFCLGRLSHIPRDVTKLFVRVCREELVEVCNAFRIR